MELLPHEIPFDIKAWPYGFTGTIIPDRPYTYGEMPTSFMV